MPNPCCCRRGVRHVWLLQTHQVLGDQWRPRGACVRSTLGTTPVPRPPRRRADGCAQFSGGHGFRITSGLVAEVVIRAFVLEGAASQEELSAHGIKRRLLEDESHAPLLSEAATSTLPPTTQPAVTRPTFPPTVESGADAFCFSSASLLASQLRAGMRIHEFTHRKITAVKHIPSADPLADFFTKVLSKDTLQRHRRAVMNLVARSVGIVGRIAAYIHAYIST